MAHSTGAAKCRLSFGRWNDPRAPPHLLEDRCARLPATRGTRLETPSYFRIGPESPVGAKSACSGLPTGARFGQRGSTLVQVDHLSKKYGDVAAIADVTF